ncbi:conserved hypothetical protein [Vibrio phage 168E36-1]|nr:conserved hypothetical protein [Vibrio phage 168E36-1]
MQPKISTAEAKRNRIMAETARLTKLGLTADQIARQLGVKRNLILRLKDLTSTKTVTELTKTDKQVDVK